MSERNQRYASRIEHSRDIGSCRHVVAIVGGGFTGICFAAHLRRTVSTTTAILVFERGTVGRGLAYGSNEPGHLLNSPSGFVSAFDDDPDGFIGFIQADEVSKAYLDPNTSIQHQFVPRFCYGRYIENIVADLKKPYEDMATVHFINTEVVNLKFQDAKYILLLADGRKFLADIAVLAVGHPSPLSISDLVGKRWLVDNPWDSKAINRISPESPVAIVGSGQTSSDVASQLLLNGHRARISLISRRGRIALPYKPVMNPPAYDRAAIPSGLLSLVRWFRSEVATRVQSGDDWRPAVNALRPHTQSIWLNLSLREKQSFVRHLAPFWNTHRKRLPPRTVARLFEAMSRNQLVNMPGRIVGRTDFPDHQLLKIKLRGKPEIATLKVSSVINCTGPAWDLRRAQNELVRRLLDAKLVRWDDLGRGLEINESSAVLNGRGEANGSLFALGPICTGSLLEIVAIREIRAQCAKLAQHIASTCRLNERVAPDLRFTNGEVASRSSELWPE